jgi:hypothetical protein
LTNGSKTPTRLPLAALPAPELLLPALLLLLPMVSMLLPVLRVLYRMRMLGPYYINDSPTQK